MGLVSVSIVFVLFVLPCSVFFLVICVHACTRARVCVHWGSGGRGREGDWCVCVCVCDYNKMLILFGGYSI